VETRHHDKVTICEPVDQAIRKSSNARAAIFLPHDLILKRVPEDRSERCGHGKNEVDPEPGFLLVVPIGSLGDLASASGSSISSRFT
jgi:hypothetical protein